MKIYSSDSRSAIRIEKHGDVQYSSFEVEVSVDIGHGAFTDKNTDVQFLNLDRFVEELNAFVLERQQIPRLQGTYDSFIAFSTPAGKTALWVEFALGDACAGPVKTADYLLKGGFEFDPEYLNEVLAGFRELKVSE